MHVKKNYKSKKSNEERLERAKGNKVMRKNQFRAFAGVAALSLCLGLGAAAMPATSTKAATEHWNDASASSVNKWEKYCENWDSIKENWKNVSITPGKDETELNFAWYSQEEETPKVRLVYGKNHEPVEFEGKQTKITPGTNGVPASGTPNRDDLTGYYSNKVTITGLEPNTDYFYEVYRDGEWQGQQKISTKDTDKFSFLYVGDPQIGASKGQTAMENDQALGENDEQELAARNDSYNWNQVLKDAVKNHPDISFMVSAGDQVNTNHNEAQYAGYLSAEVLAYLPVATTIGNHDSGSAQYSYHFNNPNTMTDAENPNASYAGTDYYYTYGNTLFIFIDTNNYKCADHENTIKKAIEENQDAKWRVVTFHHDIYGSGYDHSDSDGMVLRTQLTPMFDEYDIDVVLQGHDHTYSRTYQLTSDGEKHAEFTKGDEDEENFVAENECYEIKSDVKGGTITNPEGTVYYEANSATGSKFYELIGVRQDYIAERSQTWTPTYSVVNVTDDTFSVTTYDATTQEPVAGSSTYTIKKTDGSEDQGNQDQGGQNQDQNQGGQDQNQNQQAPQTQQPTVNNNAQTPAAAVAAAPAKVKGVKVSNKAGNKIKVKWNTQEGVTGYQIQYTYKKGFTKKVKTVNVNKASKASKVIKKMKVGKKVYVKVRAYQNVNGQNVYGKFSKVKKLTVR